MSDGGTGEKTEEPTPERLRKLRKEGNVAKSQDITVAISFLAVFAVLAAVFPWIGDNMTGLFHDAVKASVNIESMGEALVPGFLYQALFTFVKVIAPATAAAFVLGIALNVAQVGFMFTLKPITPDIKKINPVQGVKNLINKKKLIELLKTTLKFVVIGYLSYIALRDAVRDVVHIVRSELVVGVGVIGSIVWDFCIKIGAVFVAIAAFDVFYQRKRYLKDNMMSKYDVKQEYKQSEGDPHHKAARRQFHQEILNSAAPANVKNADVVVRNPHQIAVALKYDRKDGEDGKAAPKVIAKGERIWAEQILEAAKHYGVPIVRNVPLAQALNKLEIDEEIPEELYEAVAEVLNFVFQLAEEQRNKGG
jgi:flagellar biosynthetic protein FlhB